MENYWIMGTEILALTSDCIFLFKEYLKSNYYEDTISLINEMYDLWVGAGNLESAEEES